MTQQPGSGPHEARRRPSRPVSRPPRLQPTAGRGAAQDPPGGPGPVLRSLGGALLAVAAVSLGIVVLLAVRSGGRDDALHAEGGGAARTVPTPSTASAASAASAAPAQSSGALSPAPAPPSPSPPPTPAPGPAPAVPGDVTVTVLAAGGADAEATADRLRGEGWNVRLVARYRGSPPATATLFHVAGREDAAALLAARVGPVAVRPAPATLSESDLTLVVLP